MLHDQLQSHARRGSMLKRRRHVQDARGDDRPVCRLGAAGGPLVPRAGPTDVPGGPVLAEAAAEQVDHAAGPHARRRQERPRVGVQPLAPDQARRERGLDKPAAHRLLHRRTIRPRVRHGGQPASGLGRSGVRAGLATGADHQRRSRRERLGVRDAARRQHPEVHVATASCSRTSAIGLRPCRRVRLRRRSSRTTSRPTS